MIKMNLPLLLKAKPSDIFLVDWLENLNLISERVVIKEVSELDVFAKVLLKQTVYNFQRFVLVNLVDGTVLSVKEEGNTVEGVITSTIILD